MKVKDLLLKENVEDEEVKNLIEDWKKANGKFPLLYSIKNGKIDGLRSFKIVENMVDDDNFELIFPFNSCGRILVNTPLLSSFKNFPEKLTDRSDIHPSLNFTWACDRITSLEGIPKYNNSHICLGPLENVNYSHVNKHLKQINGNLAINGNYIGPLLSVLLISGLKEVYYAIPIGRMYPHAENLLKACKIISQHLQTNADILECQEELMSNKLKQYAKL